MIIVPYLCGHGAHFYSRQTPPHVSSYEGNQSHCTWDNTMSTHTGRTTWTIVWHLRIATIPGEFVRLASCRRLGISVGRLWLPLDRWDLKLQWRGITLHLLCTSDMVFKFLLLWDVTIDKLATILSFDIVNVMIFSRHILVGFIVILLYLTLSWLL